MGLLEGITNTYKKSESAVIVQNLLEMQLKAGVFESDPAKCANVLVEVIWNQKPDMFGGKFGQRPHKLSVAAAALSFAVANGPKEHPNRDAYVLTLGTLLSEFETNGRLYPLNGIDEVLLEGAAQAFAEAVAHLRRTSPAFADGFR
jgi:hypothetical protein